MGKGRTAVFNVFHLLLTIAENEKLVSNVGVSIFLNMAVSLWQVVAIFCKGGVESILVD